MSGLNRSEIMSGIFFNSITDQRFKTNRIAIYLSVPLKKETAALYALLPNVLRKGNRRFPDFSQFNNHLNELYGAYVDCSVEKLGDEQLVSLNIVGIDDRFTLDDEKITEEISKILAELLLDPVLENGNFLEKEMILEKKSLIDTIEAEINDKRTYALNASTRLMCANEPYGLSKFGTIEQVKEITKEELTQAYHALLKHSRIEVLFVGCGDCRASQKVFEDSFARIDRDYQNSVVTKPHAHVTELTEKDEKMDITQAKLVLGFSSGISSPNKQTFALLLAVSILGGTPMSKLFVNVREKLSLCYYCVARLDAKKGIVKIDSGVEQNNIEKAKAEILHQLELVQKGEFSEEEIKQAVMSIENSYRTVNDSNSAVLVHYLGQVMNGTNRTPEESAAIIRQVTRDEIIEAASLLKLDIIYTLTGKGEK